MESMLVQWITGNTRLRCHDEPSTLDLVFTRGLDDIKDVKYLLPLGKSDLIVIAIDCTKEMERKRLSV